MHTCASKKNSHLCMCVARTAGSGTTIRRKMQVSHYSLCHGSATGECDLVNWVCEGYDSTIKM